MILVDIAGSIGEEAGQSKNIVILLIWIVCTLGIVGVRQSHLNSLRQVHAPWNDLQLGRAVGVPVEAVAAELHVICSISLLRYLGFQIGMVIVWRARIVKIEIY